MKMTVAEYKTYADLTKWIGNDEYESDSWFNLSDRLDVNFYIDPDGKKHAKVFLVINKCTRTDLFVDELPNNPTLADYMLWGIA